MKRYEVIIVGAGPSGLSAAIEAAKRGLKVVVFDENEKPGGQLFKQIHKFFGSKEHHAKIRGFRIGEELLKEADELASDLVTTLNNTQGIEFAIIDAGQRNSSFARAIAAKAHMAITILEAEGNSLNRLNEIEIEDNEYLLLNKVTRKSKIMTDIVLLLRESKIKNSLLNSDISYDESVMNSFLYDMPYSRYFSVSSASLDTEKVMFEIILICNAVNGNTTL